MTVPAGDFDYERLDAGYALQRRTDPEAQTRAMDQLRADLASGEWDRRFGALRTQPTFDGSLRLIVSTPPQRSLQR
jgi:hypothetical protein